MLDYRLAVRGIRARVLDGWLLELACMCVCLVIGMIVCLVVIIYVVS